MDALQLACSSRALHRFPGRTVETLNISWALQQ
jgi:hypothetical protein